MNPINPTATSMVSRRRSFLSGLAARCFGAWLTIFSLNCFGRESPLPNATVGPTAGRLPGEAPADDANAAKQDAAARKVAETVLAGITKKDAASIVAVSSTPFLGGPMHNQRLIRDRDAIAKSLHDELFRPGLYGPYMFEPQWEVGGVLNPAEFFERYAEHLIGSPETRKLLANLRLGATDRLVIENKRGMLVIVRAGDGETRLIGIVPAGFQPRAFQLTRDVIYGRKYGVALTLDVLQPLRNGNRAAVLQLVSDTFTSNPPVIGGNVTMRVQGLLDAGYTVIFVTHSSAPKHTIPEILGDTHRAVRFVRHNAKRLDLDPDRIAIMGASSGGYLALMVGTADGKGPSFPPAADPAWMSSKGDPVEAVSSRVQTVISYFPPTDWLNYGEAGKSVLGAAVFRKHLGVFDFYESDGSRSGFTRITDDARIERELKELSPVNRADRNAAPALIFHGEKDANVPLQQSQRMVEALQKSGVAAELIVKKGVGHGWADDKEDTAKIVSWLNQHLRAKE
jgi:acetyl esterase/lipase